MNARILLFALGALASSTGLACDDATIGDAAGPARAAGGPWAEWPMPNCPGDVAAGAPNPEAYTDNGNGTITDNVTGLVWQQTVPAMTYSWADAMAYCPTLTLAGHRDWRLPSRIELVSIIDDSAKEAARPPTPFRGTRSGYFWSSSPVADTPTDAWAVVFIGGTYGVVMLDPNNVRCVR